ncbi:MAG: hypothetical protein NZV14_03890 [Bryobacteraceae bacterium]|nr:hypothetical protein [Bryobacteraceae bacterium]MDW8377273.1 hypothetical protein [Bryobacterales bacterium]
MQRNRCFSFTVRAAMALWLAATGGNAWSASPIIGIATARGTFALDASTISGHGTLFEGSALRTAKSASQVHLNNGVRVLIDTGSLTRIYHDHMVLEQGAGQIEAPPSSANRYRVEAAGLEIHTPQSSIAKVAVKPDQRVLVAALQGPISVHTATGMLVANLKPGHALEFDAQQAGAAAPVKMTGLLTKSNGHFLLTDDISGVTVEVQGDCLDRYVGKTVQIQGVVDPSAHPVAGASQLVRVKGCDSGAVMVSGGQGKATAGARTASRAPKKAIIAGVVVAGAAAGSAIALTAEDKAPISR